MRMIKSKYTMVICVILLLAPIQSAGCSEFTRSSIIREKLSGYKSDLQPVNVTNYYAQVLFQTEKEKGLTSIDKPVSEKHKRKNPTLALGLAFFPGFFVHGLGHYYIGDYWVGSGLLTVEIISIGTIFWNAVEEFGAQESSSKTQYPTETLTTIALGLFFGSWIYDFCGAPTKAIKMNKEHESSFYIYPEIKRECVSLKLAYMWR